MLFSRTWSRYKNKWKELKRKSEMNNQRLTFVLVRKKSCFFHSHKLGEKSWHLNEKVCSLKLRKKNNLKSFFCHPSSNRKSEGSLFSFLPSSLKFSSFCLIYSIKKICKREEWLRPKTQIGTIQLKFDCQKQREYD